MYAMLYDSEIKLFCQYILNGVDDVTGKPRIVVLPVESFVSIYSFELPFCEL